VSGARLMVGERAEDALKPRGNASEFEISGLGWEPRCWASRLSLVNAREALRVEQVVVV
jgi:hypothetical protein